MKITVTLKDIKQGRRGSSDCCPVALAVFRRVKRGVSVAIDLIWLAPCETKPPTSRDWKGTTYVLPAEAQAFVRDFDDGLSVRPFSFTLK